MNNQRTNHTDSKDSKKPGLRTYDEGATEWDSNPQERVEGLHLQSFKKLKDQQPNKRLVKHSPHRKPPQCDPPPEDKEAWLIRERWRGRDRGSPSPQSHPKTAFTQKPIEETPQPQQWNPRSIPDPNRHRRQRRLDGGEKAPQGEGQAVRILPKTPDDCRSMIAAHL